MSSRCVRPVNVLMKTWEWWIDIEVFNKVVSLDGRQFLGNTFDKHTVRFLFSQSNAKLSINRQVNLFLILIEILAWRILGKLSVANPNCLNQAVMNGRLSLFECAHLEICSTMFDKSIQLVIYTFIYDWKLLPNILLGEKNTSYQSNLHVCGGAGKKAPTGTVVFNVFHWIWPTTSFGAVLKSLWIRCVHFVSSIFCFQ